MSRCATAALQVKGRLDEALARYKETLALRRELGDTEGEARALTNIGTIERLLRSRSTRLKPVRIMQ